MRVVQSKEFEVLQVAARTDQSTVLLQAMSDVMVELLPVLGKINQSHLQFVIELSNSEEVSVCMARLHFVDTTLVAIC